MGKRRPGWLAQLERKALTMLKPIYAYDNIRAAYHLRYIWTGWPTTGVFPQQLNDDCFAQLDQAWASDNLKRISTNWQPSCVQIAFSSIPTVKPTFCVSRAKGRLQHALRLAGTPTTFSRKVSFRAIGNNHTADIDHYIAGQVAKERFVDPRFSAMLKRFTTIDETIDLSQPSESNSGRYWYNLHVVLVVDNRDRFRREQDFETLDRSIMATAKKHHYQLAVRAWMPDHLHVALRGNIQETPAEIALALMNNTAYAMGQNAIWQRGFYVGTFSEYDVRSLRRGTI